MARTRFRTITGSFLDVRKARKLVAELKPDIVHGQGIGWYGDIAVKCSPNSVVTVHGLPHVEIRLSARTTFRDKLRVKQIDALVRRVLRRAKVVISISKYDTQELGRLIKGIPGEHCQSNRVGVLRPRAVAPVGTAAAVCWSAGHRSRTWWAC